MSLRAGESLLHYRLVEPIGEGGMGVVWRAQDTSLGRDVALKFLPAAFVQDADRRARFEREARVLAQLAHSGIAAVHGLHESGGHVFLAMEFVPGEDLASRLDRGPLDVSDAIAIAAQIAAALEAAHERGIVHRDLKPANVKLTPDGGVKVLDFGLAKAMGVTSDSGETPALSQLATVTSAGTKAGTILGTAAYMSPEQARGRALDRRADMWAFGCLIYEMLTGKRAFDGETMSDTLAAVLRSDVDLGALPRGTPSTVRDLLRRCFEKDALRRWRDAGDARLLLLDATRTDDAPAGIAPAARRRFPRLAALALLAGGLALGLIWGAVARRGAPPAVPIVADVHVPLAAEWRPVSVTISPDGRTLAIVAEREGESSAAGDWLLLRRIGDAEPHVVNARLFTRARSFSPDSKQIAFVVKGSDGTAAPGLVTLSIEKPGTPTFLAPWQTASYDTLDWGADGLLRVTDFTSATIIAISPDGSPVPPPLKVSGASRASFLFGGVLPGGDFYGVTQNWDGGYHQDVVRVDAKSGDVTVIADRAFVPHYIETGHFVFSRADQLIAVPYDVGAKKITGPQRAIASGLRWDLDLTSALFSLSSRGDLVHLTGGSIGGRRTLAFLDRKTGQTTTWEGALGPFIGSVDDSQDGRVVAVARLGSEGLFEIWASATDEARLRPILAMNGMDCDGSVVSDDGSLIAGRCIGAGPERDGIYIAPFSSSPSAGGPVRVHAIGDLRNATPISWIPGEAPELLFAESENETHRYFRQVLDARGNPVGEARPVPGLGGNVLSAMASPDGRFVALVGRDGPVRRLSIASWNDGDIGVPVPVAVVEGTSADWVMQLPDGRREVVFIDADGLMATTLVDSSGRFTAPKPVEGYANARRFPGGEAFFSDGRVLMIQPDEAESRPADIHLVLGWMSTWAD